MNNENIKGENQNAADEQGRREAKTAGTPNLLKFLVQQKLSPTNLLGKTLHDILKFQHIYNRRKLKKFLVKLFLACTVHHLQSDTRGVHGRPGRTGRPLIY